MAEKQVEAATSQPISSTASDRDEDYDETEIDKGFRYVF